MTFRAATQDDVPALDAFLTRHLDTSVFLVSNLRKFGPQSTAHPYAMRYWITGDPIDGVIAQSAAGVVMAQWPDTPDWTDAIAVLPDPITGAIGDGDQMNALLHTAELRDKPTNLDADEVLMALDLSNVVPQDGPGTLRPLRDDDRPVLTPWRTDYAINILGEPAETGPARADEEITAYIAADSHRALVDDTDTPISMTGFNGTVDGLVQVGGVYTPPHARGCGLARRAVALHLIEARARGATCSILFGNDPSAIAAYRAVGFTPIGRFALIMFSDAHTPQVAL